VYSPERRLEFQKYLYQVYFSILITEDHVRFPALAFDLRALGIAVAVVTHEDADVDEDVDADTDLDEKKQSNVDEKKQFYEISVHFVIQAIKDFFEKNSEVK
jgi:hypothetical protein